MSPAVYLTVDIDRDANIPVKGEVAAGSAGGETRFAASMQGFYQLTKIMADKGANGSYFFEARTLNNIMEVKKRFDAMLGGLDDFMKGQAVGCHGIDHEDLTGQLTEVEVPKDDVVKILFMSKQVVSEAFPENEVNGFRAPYLKVNPTVLEAAAEAGFTVDSSLTVSEDFHRKSISPDAEQFVELPGGVTGLKELQGNGVTAPPKPFDIETPAGSLKEIPLPMINVADKPRTTYFWPLFEGKMTHEEFTERILSVLDEDNGKLLLALHTWHLVCKADGNLHDKTDGLFEGTYYFKKVLKGLMEAGVEFKPLEW